MGLSCGNPTAFAVTNTSATSIHIGWTDNADNELSYRIERCDGAGCSSFSEIASLAANTGTYDDNGLTFGESYTYRVRAANASGFSSFTSTLTETTIVPAAPTTLVATTMSATSVQLSWSDNASNEVTYKLERCTGDPCSNFAPLVTLDSNSTGYLDSSVPTGSSFTYRVYAERPAGVSNFSNTAVATTSFPAEPSLLAAVTASGWTSRTATSRTTTATPTRG